MDVGLLWGRMSISNFEDGDVNFCVCVCEAGTTRRRNNVEVSTTKEEVYCERLYVC